MMIFFAIAADTLFVIIALGGTILFLKERNKIVNSMSLQSVETVDYSWEGPQTALLLLSRLLSAGPTVQDKVRTLSLRGTHLEKLPDLAELRALKTLDLSDTLIDSLIGIGSLAGSLQALSLSGTRIHGDALRELMALTHLNFLNISDTQGLDLNFIAGNQSLKAIILDDATVHNTAALLTCKNLKLISVSGSTLLGKDGIVRANDDRVINYTKLRRWFAPVERTAIYRELVG